MNTCDICGVYTRPTVELCYACLNQSEKECSLNERRFYEDNSSKYIKGNIAEALTQNLFISCRFRVMRLGIEYRGGFLFGQQLQRSGYSLQDISHVSSVPDFSIENVETKSSELVEVKYRANGTMPYSEVKKIKTQQCIVLLFSKERPIVCMRVKDILEVGKPFLPKKEHYLKNNNLFNIDVGMIEIFETYTKMLYSNLKPVSEV